MDIDGIEVLNAVHKIKDLFKRENISHDVGYMAMLSIIAITLKELNFDSSDSLAVVISHLIKIQDRFEVALPQ